MQAFLGSIRQNACSFVLPDPFASGVVMTLEDDRPARAAPSAADPVAAPTPPPAPPGPRDLLSQVLLGLRLEGIAYTRSHLRAPWGVALAAHAQTEAVFHFVARGSCWLRVEDGEWLRLSAGDAVLLPRGSAHVLASAQDVPGAQFDSLARKAVASNIFLVEALAGSAGAAPEGGQASAGQAGDAIFSGTLRFDLDPLHPLLAMMPTLMHAGALAERDPLVPTLLEAMERELAQDRVGSCGILARMADVLAASIIRAWIECACGASQGWLAGGGAMPARGPGQGRHPRRTRGRLDGAAPGGADERIAFALCRHLHPHRGRKPGALRHPRAHGPGAPLDRARRPARERGRNAPGL